MPKNRHGADLPRNLPSVADEGLKRPHIRVAGDTSAATLALRLRQSLVSTVDPQSIAVRRRVGGSRRHQAPTLKGPAAAGTRGPMPLRLYFALLLALFFAAAGSAAGYV